jgi:hypothetical protein
MKSVSFRARQGGDGECFLFCNVPEEDLIALLGKEQYESDIKDEIEFLNESFTGQMSLDQGETIEQAARRRLSRVYPGTIMDAMGCEHDKMYKITVTVEEIK